MRLFALLSIVATLAALSARAGEARVAVASNFRGTADALAEAFAAETGHKVVISAASTGILFAQISRGAPFDVFLSADAARPEALETQGIAIRGTRRTYAIGRLVFVARDPALITPHGPNLGAIRTLSIANPETAPYGTAAAQFLAQADGAPDRIAQAQNVAGVLAAVEQGAADGGFTAASLARGRELASWDVPGDLHLPLRQDAVLLKPGKRKAAALAFLDWLGSEQARQIIRDHGYDVD